MEGNAFQISIRSLLWIMLWVSIFLTLVADSVADLGKPKGSRLHGDFEVLLVAGLVATSVGAMFAALGRDKWGACIALMGSLVAAGFVAIF